jgi:hypothetical protein
MKVNMEAIPDGQEIDFKIDIYRWDTHEVMYWRKFWVLQNWMENLYVSKGGLGGEYGPFNGPRLLITQKDAYKLKSDIEYKTLRNSDGAILSALDFWQWDQMEEDADKLIEMIMRNPYHKFYYYSSY